MKLRAVFLKDKQKRQTFRQSYQKKKKRKKEKEKKEDSNKIRNERGDIATDPTKTQRL